MLIRPGRAAKGVRPFTNGGRPRLNLASPLAHKLAMWVPVTGGITQVDAITHALFTPEGDQLDLRTTVSPIGGYQITQNSGIAPFGNYTTASVFGAATTATTIAVWVPAHAVALDIGGAFIKVGNASTGYALGLGNGDMDNNGNEILGLFEAIRWIDTNTNLTRAQDNLLAMTLPASGASVIIYLNGQQIYTDSTGAPVAPTTSTGLFGYNNSRRLWGVGCEFRLWNRALTAFEHWQLWDPASRWDHYYRPNRQVFFDVGAVVALTEWRGEYPGILPPPGRPTHSGMTPPCYQAPDTVS